MYLKQGPLCAQPGLDYGAGEEGGSVGGGGGGEQQQSTPCAPHIGRHVTAANANSRVVSAKSMGWYKDGDEGQSSKRIWIELQYEQQVWVGAVQMDPCIHSNIMNMQNWI